MMGYVEIEKGISHADEDGGFVVVVVVDDEREVEGENEDDVRLRGLTARVRDFTSSDCWMSAAVTRLNSVAWRYAPSWSLGGA